MGKGAVLRISFGSFLFFAAHLVALIGGCLHHKPCGPRMPAATIPEDKYALKCLCEAWGCTSVPADQLPLMFKLIRGEPLRNPVRHFDGSQGGNGCQLAAIHS